MKKFDEKTKRVQVVFNTYEAVKDSCPECGRHFKENDSKFFEQNGWINCSKCGAKLKK